MDLLLQSSASDALWGVATIIFYIGIGAAWAGYGYYKNNLQTGEELDILKALPVLLAGALVGLAVVSSGQELDSGYILAITGFLVPLLDKIWKTVRMSYGTATDMYEDGESLQAIALEIAEIVDREIDQEDVEQVIAEYERRFGPLDPSHENVQERSEQLREDYETGGVEDAIDGAHQSDTEAASVDEPDPDEDGDLFGRDPSLTTSEPETADADDEVVRDGP